MLEIVGKLVSEAKSRAVKGSSTYDLRHFLFTHKVSIVLLFIPFPESSIFINVNRKKNLLNYPSDRMFVSLGFAPNENYA